MALQLERLLRLPLSFFLQLRFFLGELFRLLERLPFGLGLQSRLLRPRFRALLLALFLASRAFAADRLQIGFYIIRTVIVVDLRARLDVFDGSDEDLALARFDVGFRVRLAGVVDITGDVLAHRTVDGPAVVQFEQVLVLDRVVFFLLAIQQRPKIADDLGALLDRLGGEEAESGNGAADAIGLMRWYGRHDD